MTSLPVIVGFGGCNAAGRSSFHQAYLRMVIENIKQEQRREVITGLAVMMNRVSVDHGNYRDCLGKLISEEAIVDEYGDTILNNTLIRRINADIFDADNVLSYKDVSLAPDDNAPLHFQLPKKQLPDPLPNNWRVSDIGARQVTITVTGNLNVKVPTTRITTTQSAGQLPTGFNPATLYNSRFHPRGLQMTVIGASDAINSIGIEWNNIMASVTPDQVAVYASSAMGQMDEFSNSGLLQARLTKGRVSSKQLPLGFTSMPAVRMSTRRKVIPCCGLHSVSVLTSRKIQSALWALVVHIF